MRRSSMTDADLKRLIDLDNERYSLKFRMEQIDSFEKNHSELVAEVVLKHAYRPGMGISRETIPFTLSISDVRHILSNKRMELADKLYEIERQIEEA
jgi:hypothetical protein